MTALAGILALFPFALSEPEPGSVADVGAWVEAPAGRHGFLRVDGEHFVNDAGIVRLNGINLTGPANFPSRAEADRLARRFAALGFNCVRLHLFDLVWYRNAFQPPARGIFLDGSATTQTVDPEQLDRLDYLIAALKRRGVYVDVNLHAGQTLDARDGFPDNAPMNHGYDLWYPPMIRAERAYWRALLTHVNPHTGLALKDDPAVALLEITNENALFPAWCAGRTRDMPEPYAREWRRQRAEWLAGRPPDTNEVRFVDALERRYWRETRAWLRNLGVKAPIVGTQLGYSTPYRLAELDAIDIHIYYAHPAWTKPENWRACNVPLVNTPGYDIRDAAAARIAGMPFLTSETSTPYPNFYGADHQPIVRAVAALQDWAGVFAYSWNNTTNAFPARHEFFFYNAMRPEVLAHLPAAAAMFLRRGVSVARTRADVPLTEPAFFAAFGRGGCKSVPVATCARATDGAFDNDRALVHGVGIDLHGPGREASPPEPDRTGLVRRSETGEIVWDRSRKDAGVFTVNTPMVKFFSGFAAGRRISLGDVTLEPASNRLGWCAVSLLKRGDRSLLAATGLTHNGGARFTFEANGVVHARGGDFGSGPVVTEGVKVRVTVPDEQGSVRCFALDGAGRRVTEVPVGRGDGRATVETDARYRTVWYELSREIKENR